MLKDQSYWLRKLATLKHRHWQMIVYSPARLEHAVEQATRWAEKFRAEFAKYQKTHLPWLKSRS